MKVLFDTSLLIAALVFSHPAHARALAWMKKARSGDVELVLSAHTLAETYAVLTALPVAPRIPPPTAWRMIRDNILACGKIVSLSAGDYGDTLEKLAGLGVAGGSTCDALVARVALKAGADRIVTLNPDHFRRVAPETAGLVIEP